MNTALSEFDTLIFDGIGKQASFIKKTVTVSDSDAFRLKISIQLVIFQGR